MIVTSGDLLLTVVNDVLDYSKLESGNVEINIKNCNLQDTMNAVVHSIESKSVDKGMRVRKFYDIGKALRWGRICVTTFGVLTQRDPSFADYRTSGMYKTGWVTSSTNRKSGSSLQSCFRHVA